MVTNVGARMGQVFGAISDANRRQILDLLQHEGELSAGALAQQFPISRPAISRHLRILRRAGLVREQRCSRQRIYSLEPRPLAEVDRWLSRYRVFWGARLHDLKQFVEKEPT